MDSFCDAPVSPHWWSIESDQSAAAQTSCSAYRIKDFTVPVQLFIDTSHSTCFVQDMSQPASIGRGQLSVSGPFHLERSPFGAG